MKKENKLSTRRGFLAQAAALAALFGVKFLGREPGKGVLRRRDKDLREADYYSRHDLAG